MSQQIPDSPSGNISKRTVKLASQNASSAGDNASLDGSKLDKLLKKRLEKVEEKLKAIRSRKSSISEHGQRKSKKSRHSGSTVEDRVHEIMMAEVGRIKRKTEAVADSGTAADSKKSRRQAPAPVSNKVESDVLNLCMMEETLAKQQLEQLIDSFIQNGVTSVTVNDNGVNGSRKTWLHNEHEDDDDDDVLQANSAGDVGNEMLTELSHSLTELCSTIPDGTGYVQDSDAQQMSLLSDFARPSAAAYGPSVDDTILELNCGGPEMSGHGELQHLGCLSVDTQFDSQFVDSMSVKLTHLNTVKDWRTQKPLDLLIAGHLRVIPIASPLFITFPPTDELVKDCLHDLFERTARLLSELLETAEPGPDTDNIRRVLDNLSNHFSERFATLTDSIAAAREAVKGMSVDGEPRGLMGVAVASALITGEGYEEMDQPESQLVASGVVEAEPLLVDEVSSGFLVSFQQQLASIRDSASQQAPTSGHVALLSYPAADAEDDVDHETIHLNLGVNEDQRDRQNQHAALTAARQDPGTAAVAATRQRAQQNTCFWTPLWHRRLSSRRTTLSRR